MRCSQITGGCSTLHSLFSFILTHVQINKLNIAAVHRPVLDWKRQFSDNLVTIALAGWADRASGVNVIQNACWVTHLSDNFMTS